MRKAFVALPLLAVAAIVPNAGGQVGCVQPAPQAGCVILPKPLTVKGGQATITFNAAFVSAVDQAEVSLRRMAPATRAGDAFTLPVRAGRVNRTGTRARIRHRGGLRFSLIGGSNAGYTATERQLAGLQARIRGRRLVILARLGGTSVSRKPVPYFRGRGTGRRTGNRYSFRANKLRLTAGAARDLATLGIDVSAGQVVGSARFAARKRA